MSTFHRYLQVCALCLHPDVTCDSMYCVYILATRAGPCVVSTLWRNVQARALCLHCNETCRYVHCVYTLARCAGLCIVSTFHRYVQVCALCLHSEVTCDSMYCVYTLATHAGPCIVSTLWTMTTIFVVLKQTERHASVSMSCDVMCWGKASFIWSFALRRPPEKDLQF